MNDIENNRVKAETALIEQIKARIAFHAKEHRHTYEVGKGVMDYLARDLLADFRAAGGALLPVKPNGTVYVIHRRRVMSATVMFVGVGADGQSPGGRTTGRRQKSQGVVSWKATRTPIRFYTGPHGAPRALWGIPGS